LIEMMGGQTAAGDRIVVDYDDLQARLP
jgi:hypothetical protein